MSADAALSVARAFERGEVGQSLRDLTIANRTPAELHHALLGAGFVCSRLPLVALRTREGLPQWQGASQGIPAASAEVAASELAYVHRDGGVVRVFPERGPTVGFEELAIRPGPFGRKSLLARPGTMALAWDDEAAVVTNDGNVLPRSLRVEDGLKFSDVRLKDSLALARAVFEKQRIPMQSSPMDASLARLPIVAKRGLSCGFTIAPRSEFWHLTRALGNLARAAVPTVVVRERAGITTLFFSGSTDVRGDARGPCHGLASMTLHAGAHVFTVDPIGYEASVGHLATFLRSLVVHLGELVAFDNVSGRDVTVLLQRRPSLLLRLQDCSGTTVVV